MTTRQVEPSASGERALTPHGSRLTTHRRAVLFDFFDTLARADLPQVIAARQRLAEATGVDAERFQALWRDNVRARTLGTCGTLEEQIASMLGFLGVEPSRDQVSRLAEADRAAWIAGVRPYADAIATLEELRRRGFVLGLVSNCTCQVGDIIRAHGFDRYVDAMALSFELGVAKPDAAIFLAACKLLDISPQEAVFVADGAEGELGAARSLGMLAVLVQHDDQNPRERTTDSCHFRISHLAELLGLPELATPAG